jgi:hypothetical protein
MLDEADRWINRIRPRFIVTIANTVGAKHTGFLFAMR